jgi:hypothetical protein
MSVDPRTHYLDEKAKFDEIILQLDGYRRILLYIEEAVSSPVEMVRTGDTDIKGMIDPLKGKQIISENMYPTFQQISNCRQKLLTQYKEVTRLYNLLPDKSNLVSPDTTLQKETQYWRG